jgi:DHA1 family multidrug resistance protein-like MFS transporter
MIGFTFVLPFQPLFIKQLGVHPLAAVELWAGVGGASTAIFVALFSPIWGAIADRTGRRVMVVRAMLAGGVTIALMAAVTNVYQLTGLRILQGIFTGTIAASTALVATSAPRERIGYAVGLLQTSIFIGISTGPLVGGLLAHAVGLRGTFLVAGVLLFAAGLLVLFFVHERFERVPRSQAGGAWQRLSAAARQPELQSFVVVLFLLQVGAAIVGAGAAANAVASLFYSRLADRRGYRPVLIWCAFGAALMYASQVFAHNPYQLIALRAGQGLFFGGLIPAANAAVGLVARPGQQGSAFGVTASAMALGQATGPLIGAGIAAAFGLPAVFVGGAAVLGLLGVWILAQVREPAPQ